MGAIRRFRDGFSRLTPQREYVYRYESGYCVDGFYGKGDYDSVEDYRRRKWSRIRKIKHRNKKRKKRTREKEKN